MRCAYCGAEIPEGTLYCEKCGTEVRIVPDYNPLEDVLTAEVRGAINDTTRPLASLYEEAYQRTDRTVARSRRDTSHTGSNNYNKRAAENERSESDRQAEREQRRKQAEKKKQLMKKKRRLRAVILFLMFAAVVLIVYLLYSNSYTGQVRKGYRNFQEQQYNAAEKTFKKAISRNKKKAEAYVGLSKVYLAKDDQESAEALFEQAVTDQPSNAAIYEANINFFVETDQLEAISELLDNCDDDNVLYSLQAYVSEAPEYSLKEGTYDEVQQVSLESSGEKIYYTTDDTKPSASSKEYTEPILLNTEDEPIIIRAISVNKKGIPSLEVKRTYQIEIPVADAPGVSPSTGQYSQAMQISVVVPTGYKAYYTLDGSEPSEASSIYSGPIDMPEGNTLFSAILVNENNSKKSGVTKRNYELSY